MWSIIVMKQKSSEDHYFVIHDSEEGLLFQSNAWENEAKCKMGGENFIILVSKNAFSKNLTKTKAGMYHREYRDKDGFIWGYGTAKEDKAKCEEEYQALKATLKTEGRRLNQENFIQLDCKILDFMYSLDGCAFSIGDGKQEERQWRTNDFIMWKNTKIRKNFLNRFFELP